MKVIDELIFPKGSTKKLSVEIIFSNEKSHLQKHLSSLNVGSYDDRSCEFLFVLSRSDLGLLSSSQPGYNKSIKQNSIRNSRNSFLLEVYP